MEKGWIETSRKGNIGENFLKFYCTEVSNLSYKRATYDENIKLGIDCWVEGIPTDIKNTCFIFLGKYSLKSGKFFIRHPFREDSQAKNYCILNINEKDRIFEIKYNGSIEDYLITKYLKDITSFIKLRQVLSKYSNKNYSELGMNSIEHFFINLKNEIKPLIKTNIYCNYESLNEVKKASELAISLITYEDNKRYRD